MPKTALANRIVDYSKLSYSEIILALRLHDEGLTQTQIAQRLGATQPTISRLINEYLDTREPARRKANNAALKLAERVIDQANVEESLEVLDRIGVLEKRQSSSGQPSVQIAIGIPGSPTGPDPLQQVNVIANYQTQKESASLTGQQLPAPHHGASEAKVEGESQ